MLAYRYDGSADYNSMQEYTRIDSVCLSDIACSIAAYCPYFLIKSQKSGQCYLNLNAVSQHRDE